MAERTPPAPPLQVFDAEAEKPLIIEPHLNKGKGKATEADFAESPPSLSPTLPKLSLTISEPEPEKGSDKLLLAGLPFTYPQISALLTRAKAEMPLRPVKFRLLGEYKDCFSGEDFFHWLLENVPEFQQNKDIVHNAAIELTEREGLLGRIAAIGNYFENTDNDYYQFNAKVLFVLSTIIDARWLTLSCLGFYPGSATISPDRNEVSDSCLALAAYCPGTRKDLWHICGYCEQGIGIKRGTPLHSAQERSDTC